MEKNYFKKKLYKEKTICRETTWEATKLKRIR